jgi:hypothetical protein
MNVSKYFLKARAYSCHGDLRNRITTAVALVNLDMLTRVWDEMDYRIMSAVSAKVDTLSICELCKEQLVSLFLFQCNKIWFPLRSLFIVNFQNVSLTYE